MFTRPRPVREPLPFPTAPTGWKQAERVSGAVVITDKFPYIRSPALLMACRQIPCQHCGAQDGTVVAAHSNQAKHGKGRAIKASDVFVASLCFSCHAELDQGAQMTRAERTRMWDACHLKTIVALVRAALWPTSVPIPLYTPKQPLALATQA